MNYVIAEISRFGLDPNIEKGHHVGNLMCIGGLWKFKAIGYYASGVFDALRCTPTQSVSTAPVSFLSWVLRPVSGRYFEKILVGNGHFSGSHERPLTGKPTHAIALPESGYWPTTPPAAKESFAGHVISDPAKTP